MSVEYEKGALMMLYRRINFIYALCTTDKELYYIQINEIQENIDKITCIFQKVLFSLVKNIKSVISLVKKYQLLDDFGFFHKFPL